MLIYPFADTLSAGPIATSTNYPWTLTALFFLILVEQKKIHINKIFYLIFVGFSLFECCLFQQTVVLFLIFLITEIVYSYWKRLKVSNQTIFFTVCSVIGLTILLLSPSAEKRLSLEVPYINPLFFQYSLFDKIILGLYRVSQFLFGQINLPYYIFCIVLMAYGYRRYYLSFIPLLLCLSALVLRYCTILNFASYYNIDEAWFQIYFSICILGMTILSLFHLLIRVNKNTYPQNSSSTIVLLTLSAGFSTLAIMGLAPSVYYSGDRTAIFFYFSIYVAILLMLKCSSYLLEGFKKQAFISLCVCLACYNIVWTSRTLIRPIFVDMESISQFLQTLCL